MTNEQLTRESQVTLREVTGETVREICRLKVTEEQNNFVAPNSVSIAQAYFAETAWFRAIYADEMPVGFVMLDDDPEKPEYFLWRFMIAAEYQGLGFGRKAIHLLADYVKTRPGAKELLVSYVDKEGGPGPFYKKLGFRPNGEMYGDEVGATLILSSDVN